MGGHPGGSPPSRDLDGADGRSGGHQITRAMPTSPECPENAPSSPALAAMAWSRLEMERPVRPNTLAAGSASSGQMIRNAFVAAGPRYWTVPAPCLLGGLCGWSPDWLPSLHSLGNRTARASCTFFVSYFAECVIAHGERHADSGTVLLEIPFHTRNRDILEVGANQVVLTEQPVAEFFKFGVVSHRVFL